MQGLAAQHHHYLPLEPDDPREIGRYPLAARLGAEEEIDFRYFSTGDDAALRTAEGNELVLLEQGQKGSFAVCVSETEATERVGMDLVTEGSQLCVRTAAGHVALVTIEALPAVEDELTVDVTVWRDAR